jgi:hypothetical protein
LALQLVEGRAQLGQLGLEACDAAGVGVLPALRRRLRRAAAARRRRLPAQQVTELLCEHVLALFDRLLRAALRHLAGHAPCDGGDAGDDREGGHPRPDTLPAAARGGPHRDTNHTARYQQSIAAHGTRHRQK